MNRSFSLSKARRHTLAALLACAVTPFAPAAMAQNDFPNKPIKIVIGFPAGGSVDQVGRVVGDALGQRLKAVVVIDNQGGAAGSIAAQRLVTSPADGYTLLVGSSNELAATKQVNPAQRYDAAKDMTPIGLIATAPVLLVAGPKAGVKTLAEMIDAAKRQPGKFSYGSSGVGTSLHLAGEMVKEQGKLFMTHIPYRGVAPLTNDLLGNNLEFGVFVLSSGLPHIKSGKVIALGTTEAKRSPTTPDIPALAESPQFKNVDIGVWFALLAPANLPKPVFDKVKKALNDSLQSPDFRKKMEATGSTVAATNVNIDQYLAAEVAKYKKIVEFAKIEE